MVALLVEELPIQPLALPLKLVRIIRLLQLHILEIQYVKQNEQLLAINRQRLLNLMHPVPLRQMLPRLRRRRRDHRAGQVAAEAWEIRHITLQRIKPDQLARLEVAHLHHTVLKLHQYLLQADEVFECFLYYCLRKRCMHLQAIHRMHLPVRPTRTARPRHRIILRKAHPLQEPLTPRRPPRPRRQCRPIDLIDVVEF